jgi:uncharacterized repeat protein (TIGR03833 family)
MDGTERKDVRPGLTVDIVMKQDQRTGRLTRSVVKDVLTKSPRHPHSIKVRLETGEVGMQGALPSKRLLVEGGWRPQPTRATNRRRLEIPVEKAIARFHSGASRALY